MTTIIEEVLTQLESRLCYHLDEDIYFPVKEEINKMCEFPFPNQHTLGKRKEDYKLTIHKFIVEAQKRLEFNLKEDNNGK